MPAMLLLAALLSHGPLDADTTVRLARGSVVQVDLYSGSVAVHTTSDDNLTVRGAKIYGRSGTVRIDTDDNVTGRPVALDIGIPAWARLDISTVNGSLTFDGTPSRLHAETVNGAITVRNGEGDVGLESVNGPVTVNGFHGGKLSIDATGSNILVTGASGEVSVESVNGAIHLRDMRASSLSASSVNQVVEYAGTFDPKGRYEIESHNGGIILSLPADVSARMEISTFNGEFSTEIEATTNGARQDVGNDKGSKGGKGAKGSKHDSDSQDFTVIYGRGDATVALDSFNGNITVRRLRGRQE